MRFRNLVPLALLSGLVVSAPRLIPSAQADGRATRSDILPVQSVKKGMKGYGLTVFEGTRPERFDVEVIDVLGNFRPKQDLILVKTTHPRLEVAKIVAGMSGSPIYLEGKMVGAYSYGWTFGVEPIAGVTPIRAMLDDLERPLPKTLHGLPLSVLPSGKSAPSAASTTSAGGDRSTRFRGAPGEYDVALHAEQRAQSTDAAATRTVASGALTGTQRLAPLATPLLLGGLTDNAVATLRDWVGPLGLEPMQAGGSRVTSSSKSAKTNGYVDGGAIGVDMVRGDLSAMGLGTVTRVEGDKLVAFGHPMMSLGVTSMPTSEARVLWFMASQMRSFKMGEGTGPLGALVNDRMASIVVDQKATAPIVPVTLHIEGEPGAPFPDWKFEVAHDEFLTPAFLAVALGSGLEATAAERRDVTWFMESTVHVAGRPPLVVQDFGSAPSGTPQTGEVMQTSLIKAVGAVFSNPWEYPRIERVDVKMKIQFSRDVAMLRGIDLLTPVLDPGEPARFRVTLEPFAGKSIVQVVSVPLPKNFAGRSVKLVVRPGYAVRRPMSAPESLDQLIANLGVPTLEPRSLVVSYETGDSGASHRGAIASSLPPSALDTLTTTSSSIAPARFEELEHVVTRLPLYMVGADAVEVRVRPALR